MKKLLILVVLLAGCVAKDAFHPTNQERRQASDQQQSLVGNGNSQSNTTNQTQNTQDSKTANLLALTQLVGTICSALVVLGMLGVVSYYVAYLVHKRVRKKNSRADDKSTTNAR